MRPAFVLLAILVALTGFSGCRQARISGRNEVARPERNRTANGRVRFEHSIQLQVSDHDGYRVVDFHPSVLTRETMRLVLADHGVTLPAALRAEQVIRVPVTRIVTANHAMNSTLEALEVEESVVGVNSFRGITAPKLARRAAAGLIHETGGGTHSNIEKTLALDPDIYFTFYSAYPQHNMHPKLWEAGLHAIPLSDHTEPTPLARAEWIKFVALFFHKEREANRLFEGIVERYGLVAERARTVTSRPPVLAGFPSGRDIWSAHGGRNYIASLIHDAGGEYVWKDGIHGSLVYVNFERMFDTAIDADAWMTGGFLPPTLALLGRQNPPLAWLRPVTLGNVLNPGRGLSPLAPMPYHDQSLDKPDLVLADLMHFLHPEILPSHRPVYFERLPR